LGVLQEGGGFYLVGVWVWRIIGGNLQEMMELTMK